MYETVMEDRIQIDLPLATTLKKVKVKVVEQVVAKCEGDCRQAAKLLGISLPEVYRQLAIGAKLT